MALASRRFVRFRRPRVRHLAAAAILCLVFSAGEARAQACVLESCLPPPNSAYAGMFHALYLGPGVTVDLSNPLHHSFTNCTAPPPSLPGATAIHEFDSLVDFDLSVNGGPVVAQRAPAHVLVLVRFASETVPTRYFDTEILSLTLTGGTLPPGAVVRESPTRPSLGQTSIRDLGGGEFQVDSFFDVFTELSLDGGQTWIPSSQSGRMTLDRPGCPTQTQSSTWGRLRALYR